MPLFVSVALPHVVLQTLTLWEAGTSASWSLSVPDGDGVENGLSLMSRNSPTVLILGQGFPPRHNLDRGIAGLRLLRRLYNDVMETLYHAPSNTFALLPWVPGVE